MRSFLESLSHKYLFILSALIYAFISYVIVREQFFVFIGGVSVLYGLLILIYRKIDSDSLFSTWLLAGFLIRYLLLFSLPVLSDDIYRFYWDGLCSTSGISPFLNSPTALLEQGKLIPDGIDAVLYSQLNSPDYYSVYPAFLQYLFSFASSIAGPNNLLVFSMIIKGIIIAFEVGTVFLLVKLADIYTVARKKVLLYALNPLVIIELNANIHFEVIMIFFLLLCIYLWSAHKYWAGTASLSLAVATKLVPLIFMPFLIRRVGWRKTILLGVFLLALNAIYHLPFISTDIIQNMYSSVALYYNKFEFNASLYYLMRWVGFKTVGWNMIASIGKILQLCTFLGIFILALTNKKRDSDNLLRSFYWALIIFLLFSTTVHPWYIATLIALGIFYYKTPLIWSFLIFLTYAAYLHNPYSENLYLTFIEYIIVLPMLLKEYLNRSYKSVSTM